MLFRSTVTLQLEEELDGKDVAIIHETHEEDVVTGYKIIDAEYNEDDNTITFETNGFSNYAIVSKAKSSITENTTSSSISNSPKTGDNKIIVWISLSIVSILGIVIITNKSAKYDYPKLFLCHISRMENMVHGFCTPST